MLSFIVPMYNVAPYIQQCLDSLVNQPGFADIHVIVVNDGSTDHSADLLKPYVAAYGNVQLLHKANGGLGAARNFGLAHATTDYVFFLDADDWVAPEAIPRLLALIRAERPDIVKFNHCRIDVSGNEHPDNPTDDASFTTVLSAAAPSSACFQIFKRALFVDNKLTFEDKYYEDLSLTFKVYHKAEKIINIADVLYFYRCREGSITASFSQEKLNDLFYSHQSAVDYIERLALLDKHADDLFLRLVRISIYAAKKIFNLPGKHQEIAEIVTRFTDRCPLDAAFARVFLLDIKATADFHQYLYNGVANYARNLSRIDHPHIPFDDISNFRASEIFNEIRSYFAALTRDDIRYVIYGDGWLSKFLASTTDNAPVAIADRIYHQISERAGQCYIPPAAIMDTEFDLVFISVLGRETAISTDLIKLGVPREKIKIFKSAFLSL